MEVVEKKKELVPELRFSEFKGEWEKPKLSERMEIFRGASPRPKGDPRYYGGEIPRLMIEDVTRDGKYAFPSIDFLTEEGAKKSRLLKKGSIVLSCSGTRVAIPGILGVDACIHDGWISFKNIDNIDVDFLYALFVKLHERMQGSATTGGVFNNLTTSIVKDLKMGFPTLPEQQKIAAFLSAVDEKIQQLRQKKALLEKYKKGVMQKLFPKKAGQAPELRFKKPDGSNYPDWEEKKLNELSNPIKRTSESPLEEIMTISGANGFLSQKERFSQVIAGSSLSKYTHLLEGEFAYNRGNSKSFKYGCIYKMPIKEALIPYVYHCFKFHEGNNTDFYQQLFLHKYLDRQLRRLISSSARMDGLLNIGAKEFFKVKLPKPCLEEQERIGKFLSGIDQKINQVETQINQTQTFKKGLLQQMFV